MVLLLDSAFEAALSKTPSTLCWCWLITRCDGGIIGFTSLDVSIEIDNITYHGTTGFNPGAIQNSQGVDKVDSQTLAGFFDASAISKRDLDAGIYDNASVRSFLVDFTNLPSSLDLDLPKHREFPTSYIGEKKRTNLGYELQTKDLISKLDNKIGSVTSKTCRTTLGSPDCGVDLTPWTHIIDITSITDPHRIFAIGAAFPDRYFDRGFLKFNFGENAGLYFDVAFYANNQIILATATPFPIGLGDDITVVAGCDHTKRACITKFRNFARFFGEPDIPTTDLSVNTPKD
ncbi:MAG: DUF2163 domain-containing protein [Cyanobacteria bacterium P01_A01_bin.40]